MHCLSVWVFPSLFLPLSRSLSHFSCKNTNSPLSLYYHRLGNSYIALPNWYENFTSQKIGFQTHIISITIKYLFIACETLTIWHFYCSVSQDFFNHIHLKHFMSSEVCLHLPFTQTIYTFWYIFKELTLVVLSKVFVFKKQRNVENASVNGKWQLVNIVTKTTKGPERTRDCPSM